MILRRVSCWHLWKIWRLIITHDFSHYSILIGLPYRWIADDFSHFFSTRCFFPINSAKRLLHHQWTQRNHCVNSNDWHRRWSCWKNVNEHVLYGENFSWKNKSNNEQLLWNNLGSFTPNWWPRSSKHLQIIRDIQNYFIFAIIKFANHSRWENNNTTNK